MIRRRVSRGTSRGRSRRKVVWALYSDTFVQPATSAAKANMLDRWESASGFNVSGATVLRLVGHLNFSASVAGPTGFDMGIGVFPSQLTSALVGPDLTPFERWMYLDYRRTTISSIAPSDISGACYTSWDLRGKRKLSTLDSLRFPLRSQEV